MTNEQILTKAIEKVDIDELNLILKIWGIEALICRKDYYSIIFSHDFAKSFWGEEEIYLIESSIKNSKAGSFIAWRYYQHKMLDEVQEGKDPIKYLKKFI